MTSYPYCAFIEEAYTKSPVVFTGWELVFATKKSGEWVKAVVDSGTGAEPIGRIGVANNGVTFAIMANQRVYESLDEGVSWENVGELTGGPLDVYTHPVVYMNGLWVVGSLWPTISTNLREWTEITETVDEGWVWYPEQCYIDEQTPTVAHLALEDYWNKAVYYTQTQDWQTYTEPQLVLEDALVGSGGGIVGLGDALLIASRADSDYNTIRYARSRDRGQIWVADSFTISGLVGTDWEWTGWSETGQPLLLSIYEGHAYLNLSVYNYTTADPWWENWMQVVFKSSPLDSADPLTWEVYNTYWPTITWYQGHARTAPGGSASYQLWMQETYAYEYAPPGGWMEWTHRRVQEWYPLTGTSETIHECDPSWDQYWISDTSAGTTGGTRISGYRHALGLYWESEEPPPPPPPAPALYVGEITFE